MRVGIDVTPTVSGVTGVARYTRSLVDGLRAAGVDVAPFAIGRGPGAVPPRTRHIRVPLRVVQRTWQAGLPLHAEHICGSVDVVHSTDLIPPPTRRPLVATVHDTAALEMPELHSAVVIRQTRKRIASLNRADVVIANSQATADALRRFVDVACIVVVPLAPYPLPEATTPPMVSGDYLLCVGEVAERKDHITLVRAYAQAKLGDCRLVIAGPAGSGSASLQSEISRLGVGERIVLTGRVDDRSLASLYAGAKALCLTSRQEGFGLPLVEAMHRGLPIVASDLPAIREVSGSAALLAPPRDVDAFATAFEQVVEDDGLRARLVQAAQQRAGLFSLTRTVNGTIAAYERALTIS